jgi:hypothetical protein
LITKTDVKSSPRVAQKKKVQAFFAVYTRHVVP